MPIIDAHYNPSSIASTSPTTLSKFHSSVGNMDHSTMYHRPMSVDTAHTIAGMAVTPKEYSSNRGRPNGASPLQRPHHMVSPSLVAAANAAAATNYHMMPPLPMHTLPKPLHHNEYGQIISPTNMMMGLHTSETYPGMTPYPSPHSSYSSHTMPYHHMTPSHDESLLYQTMPDYHPDAGALFPASSMPPLPTEGKASSKKRSRKAGSGHRRNGASAPPEIAGDNSASQLDATYRDTSPTPAKKARLSSVDNTTTNPRLTTEEIAEQLDIPDRDTMSRPELRRQIHIVSEQRRRKQLNGGFDFLEELLPIDEGEAYATYLKQVEKWKIEQENEDRIAVKKQRAARVIKKPVLTRPKESKPIILQKAADYIQKLVAENRELKARLGIPTSEDKASK